MTTTNTNELPPETQILRPSNNGASQALKHVAKFGAQETEQIVETQGTALAARAQAETQARYVMAMQRPRKVEDFRVRLLDHCRRPGFALIASYEKPVGGQKIKGPSIRFVETALQEFGNVLPEETITYDDDFKRVVQVKITDLERNITYSGDVIVEKTVERKKPKDGDEILGSRLNSNREVVYKIRATEDDFANKVGAACSKKLRNLGIRILPADIVADAAEVCRETRMKKDAADPAAARRQLADAFAQLRVMPADLDVFLGHAFDQASPAELEELRGAYVTIREGDAKWNELVESARAARGEIEEASKPAAAAGEKLKASVERSRAKAAERAQQQQAQQAQAQPAQQQQPAAQSGTQPAKGGKFSNPIDTTATTKPAAAQAPLNPPTNDKSVPPKANASTEGSCSMCGVPIELDENADPNKQRCEACANE